MAKVALIITQGFADWEYALIAGTGGYFYGLDVQFFSPEVGKVQSQGGLTALVSKNLDDLVQWEADAVVVVGGVIWETDQAPDITQLLKDERLRGAVVAGICGGTLALARAGLLDDVRHTSNGPGFLAQHVSGYAGSVRYVASSSATSDDRVITAPGSAPVSFTAALFDAVGLGQETVASFRTMMGAEHS